MTNKIKSKQIDIDSLANKLDDRYVAKENLNVSKTCFIITDVVNGHDYIIQMYDGNLISYSKCTGIEVTTDPTTTTYMDGQAFDPTGMVVTATCEDGTTREIKNYTYEVHVVEEEFIITYTELGNTFTAIVDLTVNDFNPATVLVDFNYTDNGDGTYSITSWKGTLNGVTSTEMVVPNNKYVIV